MKGLILPAIAVLSAVSASLPRQASAKVYIRVNQVGYLPDESKVALALTNENLNAYTFDVITPYGSNVEFSGSVGTDRGPYGDFAHLYELDFSSLAVPGSYRVRVGSDSSGIFPVDSSAYTRLLSVTLEFFRVQRCGNTRPRLHGACHVVDGTVGNGSLKGSRAITDGGWHDAGDYLKFVHTTGFSAIFLLHAYRSHPEVFPDADRNGVPDVLDQARVALDWLLKMWDSNNQILFYQVGDYRDHHEFGASPGWRMPERDDTDRPETRTVWACAPGQGANVAGKAAGALALAASIWDDPSRSFRDSSLASSYLRAAQAIYSFGKARPAAQSSTSDPSFTPAFIFYNEVSWQDDLALAAAELYGVTRAAGYLTEARNYASSLSGTGAFSWAEVSALAHYEIARLDPTYVSTATRLLGEDLAIYLSNSNANLFRTSMSALDWGSAETLAGSALTALWHEELSGNQTYRAMAQAQRDYLLGANPWDVCFINSAGIVWPHYPHHQVADLTMSELTGYWAEGPVSQAVFAAQGITLRRTDPYAGFHSAAAVFHDDVEDYVTNEPTINMNAIGLAMAARFAPSVSSAKPRPRR